MFINRLIGKQIDRFFQEEYVEFLVIFGIVVFFIIKLGYLLKFIFFKIQSLKRDKNIGNIYCDSLQ